MNKTIFASLALCCALTTACSRGGNGAQPANNTVAAAAENTAVAAPAATANNVQAQTPAAVDGRIALTAEGFSTGQPGLHHANMISFGQAREQVVSQLAAILGQPSATGSNADCPSGAVDVVSFGALDLHFEGGRLAGYVLDGPQPAIESYHGLKVGLQRNALTDELAAEADLNSTLGTEVTVGGIGALLSGSGQDAQVTSLFAGVTCFAR